MAELRPLPLTALVTRMFRELDERDSIFDLPRRRFFLGDPERDLSVRFHGHAAATPFGPAAGPQSQMAQNLVLSWLGGARILELKTVQVDDRLAIPRPCIDMQTVGYNVEWSQELLVQQSLEEYVKGAMLIEMLVASGRIEVPAGFERTVWDMSVGYDLAGIRTDKVQGFVRGMLDASDVVAALRRQIPDGWAHLRELDFTTRLSDTLTLSTFHGCPPDEIEGICDYLLREVGLHVVVKLNPMLLGPTDTRGLLHDALGYDDVRVPDTAFERDTSWDQAAGFVERLGRTAEARGLGFGVKFTNTLIVENHRDFFPASEREMYLSGPPLHVLAMNLVQRFRSAFGDRYPVSFSAGIDRKNFPDAVALGLVPITVCSDLLKPGGYGRSKGYFDELATRMDQVGARSVGELVVRAYGRGGAALERVDPQPDDETRRACEEALRAGTSLRAAAGDELFARWCSAAALLNTDHYVPHATRDPRYHRDANAKLPRKIGSHLELFDCITCDKCIPVCPNDANFTFVVPQAEIPIVHVRRSDGAWVVERSGVLTVAERHQIGNFADFCNDCGNCDVFCPEDGGPYLIKPRFFGRPEDWRRFDALDGFCLEVDAGRRRLLARVDGRELALERGDAGSIYSGAGFRLTIDERDPLGTLVGDAEGSVDLTWVRILGSLWDAVYDPLSSHYPALFGAPR